MTEIGKPRGFRTQSLAALGVAVAIAAAAVLYGKAPPAGKVGGDCPASSAALAAKVAPLAKGEVAAFVAAKAPRPAASLAFNGPDGAKLTLADFRGRNLLVNLWATWCVPCRAEMPALDRLQAEIGGPNFEVVAVNVDTARLDRPAAFLNEIGVKTLRRYADPSADSFEALRQDGEALGLPTSLLIDAQGCEIGVVGGPAKWDSPDALALIGALKGG
jgi:thiol-disulfide isomerase/thioredoxin